MKLFLRGPGDRPPRPPPTPVTPDPQRALEAADRLVRAVEHEFPVHDTPEDIAQALFDYRRARRGGAG